MTGTVFKLGAVPCWKKQKPCLLEGAQTALAGRCWWLVSSSERLVSPVLEKLPLHGQCSTGDLPLLATLSRRVEEWTGTMAMENISKLKPGANRQFHFKIFHSALEIIGTAFFSKCKVVAMEDRKSLVCTEKENIGNCPTVKHSCLCAGRGMLASMECFPKVSFCLQIFAHICSIS